MNPCETDSLFITTVIRMALLTPAMITWLQNLAAAHPQAPPPFYRISHELVTKLFFCLRWQSLLRHVHVSVCVCLCGGLCFPGRAFDSLCCEVLLRSRRCVGEDWMNESLSQVVRWWRRWSSVSGNQPDGGRHRSRWPLIHFSHSLPLPVGVGSSHTDTAGENKPLV